MTDETRIQTQACEVMARAIEANRANRALYEAARELNLVTTRKAA